MAFNVRIFGHSGIRQIRQNLVTQFNSDSVMMLEEPYLWQQLIAVSAVAASSVVVAGDLATVLKIEVPDGQAIRYEINPNGRSVAAFLNSPKFTGTDQFPWASGWTISLIDASALL